jgi:hypothetical protein
LIAELTEERAAAEKEATRQDESNQLNVVLNEIAQEIANAKDATD